ncbi:hypothetical protein [Micromonospora cathayae]|uniref:ABC-2 type transport system permease protein n=1 Tax=Micromonospora cathayae TaxID=3028804 RepID=A0ABY7ZQS1_9ACTN|nr:hypothetical protein [Micromonospora sp. HUAS 3]WDZ85372.1 hypothetical protein PVK37_02600 [Micromonospora sp. HUAS 3]
MSALVRFRLAGFLRTGRALAPLLTGLVVLGVLYGGGRAEPAEAYGVSAVLLFPVLAWQTKLVLDVEPDVQRRLAVVAVGGRHREQAAGLLAATVAALGLVLLALVLPWPLGGLAGPEAAGDRSVPVGIALGVWAHLLAVPAAVALGALASRACAGSLGYGVAVLAVGVVGALVAGRADAVLPWLAPPLLATARATSGGVDAVAAVGLTGWAVLWAAVVLAGYGWRRRSRG